MNSKAAQQRLLRNGNILREIYMEYVGSNCNIEAAVELQTEKV